MKNLIIALLITILLLTIIDAKAAPGDTLQVRTIDFGKGRTGWFDFPTEGNWERIIMNYKLKCPDGKQCGEWDYLAHVFLDNVYAPSFRFDGDALDSLRYNNFPSILNAPFFKNKKKINSVRRVPTKNASGEDILFIGNGTVADPSTFDLSKSSNSVYYRIAKDELTAAKVLPGKITGLQFDIAELGVNVNELTIRLANLSVNSAEDQFIFDDYFSVFQGSFTPSAVGINRIEFDSDFQYDGNDILVWISTNNQMVGKSISLKSSAKNGLSAKFLNPKETIYFNGTDTYASTTNKQLGDDADQLTISVWVNTTARDNWDGIITTAGSADFTGLAFGNKINDNQFEPQFRIMSKGIINSPVITSNNDWVHIAGVWKSGEFHKLFINGSLVGEENNPADIFSGKLNINERWIVGRDRWMNNRMFQGFMKNLVIWNKALSDADINQLNSNPSADLFPDNILLNYDFDGAEISKYLIDKTDNKNNAVFAGFPEYAVAEFNETLADFDLMPNLLFEQADYITQIEKVFLYTRDYAQYEHILNIYSNTNSPTQKTDTKFVYPAGFYKYSYDANGFIIDSAFINGTELIVQNKTRVYFKDDLTIDDRFEIARYITPYGNPTADGNILSRGGTFNFRYDMSDFITLLKGKTFLWAPNDQEDLELTFDFIEGTPARNVIDIKKMWNGNYTYGKDFEKDVAEKLIDFRTDEKMARLKIIQSGHGFGGTSDNCSEFCRKNSFVRIDGAQVYSHYVWRECGDIPLYPQGGTWLVDRTNWCPGMEVAPYDYELSSFITPGSPAYIDYDMELYTEEYTPGSNQRPYWLINSYIITYGSPNFELNPMLDDVLSPNNRDVHNRYNPICGNPVVVIRNMGANNLTSLKIDYGVKDGGKADFNWTGNLKFLERDTVFLPTFDWVFPDVDNQYFECSISNPNNSQDQYSADNYQITEFDLPDELTNQLVINLKTNNYNAINNSSSPYAYEVVDMDGNTIFQRLSTENETRYIDTVQLATGCYEFRFVNQYGYGLFFWFLQRNYTDFYPATLSLSHNGKFLSGFKTDFGNSIIYQFFVGDKPQAVMSTDTVFFEKTQIGNTSLASFTISPKNSEGLQVNELKITLAEAAGVSIVSTEPSLDAGPVFLQMGESMKVNLSFTPKKHGEIFKSVNITTNDYFAPISRVVLQGFGFDPASVDDFGSKLFNLQVVPNPAQDNATVKFHSNSSSPKVCTLDLFDAAGNKLTHLYIGRLSGTVTEIPLNLQAFPAGNYFVKISDGEQSRTAALTIVR